MGALRCKWYIARVPSSRARLGQNVVALAAVSFFTDMSSEMIYPLLPVFLTTTLGASAGMLGLIEGAAETTAALLKLASGWWSDRVQRRKPLVVFGYALASVARPLIAAAQSAGQVLAIRLTDRVGKGLRGAPRDALIADSADPAFRGRAFGVQRAADHAGAVVGPLLAFALLQWWGVGMRSVFWLAAIPAAASVAIVVYGVRETGAGRARGAMERAPAPAFAVPGGAMVDASEARALPGTFWGYLAVLLVFTLGNSTDAFLLVRARQLGVPVALIPILWALLHVVKSAASTPGGALSDRAGRVPSIVAGWTVYALVYVGFAFASAPWHAWALFAAYGLVFALTEGPERALVADIVGAARRGTAYGFFNLTIGLGALPASVMFGVLWDCFGAGVAFGTGAALAMIAAGGLALLRPETATTTHPNSANDSE